MIDMKISEQEKKDQAEVSVLDTSNYPYGLKINLDSKSMKKLNMPTPQVGQKMMIECEVEVTSVYADNIKGDEKEVSCCLQIVAMEIGEESGKNAPDANSIYGAE